MRTRWALAALVALVALGMAGPAAAVEYRLFVASVPEEGMAALLPWSAGAGQTPLPRLEESLDSGGFPRGALLYDRPVQPVPPAVARAFGAGVVARVALDPDGSPGAWREIRWDGKPGDRSVWLIAPTGTGFHGEVRHLALGGGQSLRHVIPYSGTPRRGARRAIEIPLGLLQGPDGAESKVWDRYLAGRLDLSQGLAVVVGESPDPTVADRVFLVVEHPADPRTFKAVVAWRPRPNADNRIQGAGTLDR